MKNHFETIAQAHQDTFQKTFTAAQFEVLSKISHEIIGALRAGNKILLCGNGGSASDAQHIAAEFVCVESIARHGLIALVDGLIETR